MKQNVPSNLPQRGLPPPAPLLSSPPEAKIERGRRFLCTPLKANKTATNLKAGTIIRWPSRRGLWQKRLSVSLCLSRERVRVLANKRLKDHALHRGTMMTPKVRSDLCSF